MAMGAAPETRLERAPPKKLPMSLDQALAGATGLQPEPSDSVAAAAAMLERQRASNALAPPLPAKSPPVELLPRHQQVLKVLAGKDYTYIK